MTTGSGSGPRLRKVGFALAAVILARLVHDLEEFGGVSGDWVVTGLVVPVGLTWAWWRWDRSAPWTAWVLVGWLVLNAVVGGVLSVLPLEAWPFEPAQTLHHYLAHAVYTVGSLPLAWIVWRDRA